MIDLSPFIRPGDRIVCGQGTAEALTLTRALAAQAATLGPLSLFVGPLYADTFADCAGIDFVSYGAIGKAAALARAGRLDILPMPYSRLGPGFADGRLAADVVLIQLSPAPPGRRPSTGLARDYLWEAASPARVVIAEINPQVPWTPSTELPADFRIDVTVDAEYPPLELPPARIGDVERRIGAHAAELIPDRACLQIGVGTIPDAVLAALCGHRDLGIHSGLIGDAVLDLIEAGAVTNAAKAVDAGITVSGLLFGTRRLYDFAHGNPNLALRPGSHTHGAAVLAKIERFVAINSAIEVDLTGQVNAETVDGRAVGAIGGQPDFVRGANASAGGRALIALPATAAKGRISRIVPRLNDAVVTTPRCDVDAVITEWGVAELRGRTLAERRRRMIAIAAPEFREDLARAAAVNP